MKIGVIYPQIEMKGDPAAVRDFGMAAEELGYDHLIVYDHVLGAEHADRTPPLTGPYAETDPFHDPFTMLCYLAGMTKRIEFVTGVIILPQRQTALVAKQAADLALFSGGRLRLGVGLGWNHVEYQALGQDFDTRGARMDEQVPLLRRLWTEPLVTHHGRFDHIERASLTIFPQKPIPIWFGGGAPAAFRRAARLGDGFLFASAGRSSIEKASALIEARRSIGAEGPFGLEIMHMQPSASPDIIVETFQRWRDAGGTHASFSTMGRGLQGVERHVEFIGEVRRRLDRA